MLKKSNLKAIALWILCIMLILGSLAFVGRYVSARIAKSNTFYTGKYSKYCYPRTIVNVGIKKKIYFKTLEECGKPMRPQVTK